MSIQLIIGLIVILVTMYCLGKRYESRLVLFIAGLVLSCIALDPMAVFRAFTKAMTNATVIEPIIASMGFAFVLKSTKCDEHLVHLLSKGLKNLGPLLIPGAVLITAFINISITSSSGCSAAVGAILIPLLMRMGVHPAMAASAVFLGTYGSPHVNPGYHQVVIVSQVANLTPMEVISYFAMPISIAAIVCTVALTVIAFIRKEYKGYEMKEDIEVNTDFKVKVLKAIIPIVPIVLLLLSNEHLLFGLKLAISHAMIIGAILAYVVSFRDISPQKIAKEFFHGAGEGFGHVYGIVTCSLMFVGGLTAIGMIQELITAMAAYPEIAKFAGTAGPFFLALITGSGDAAAISFNTAVTVHAAEFGMNPLHLGSAVAAVAGMGRTMSPIAGAAIICSGYAGVNPIELTKRNAIPVILAAIVFVGLTLL